MSKQALSDFRGAVESSRELQNEVRAELAKGDSADFAALGRQHGFEFTAEEFNEGYSAGRSHGELTPFEMEMVSGGGAKKSRE
jgi:predicted ribosomally synthesized peptide with nif11-like leader